MIDITLLHQTSLPPLPPLAHTGEMLVKHLATCHWPCLVSLTSWFKLPQGRNLFLQGWGPDPRAWHRTETGPDRWL